MATFAEITSMEEVPENDGISFLPALIGSEGQGNHDYLFWEFPEYGGQVAIREGDYKFIWSDLRTEEPKMKLFNLADDIGEHNNIIDQHPEMVEHFMEIIKKEHEPVALERFEIEAITNLVTEQQ
jgi:arylsulfatase